MTSYEVHTIGDLASLGATSSGSTDVPLAPGPWDWIPGVTLIRKARASFEVSSGHEAELALAEMAPSGKTIPIAVAVAAVGAIAVGYALKRKRRRGRR